MTFAGPGIDETMTPSHVAAILAAKLAEVTAERDERDAQLAEQDAQLAEQDAKLAEAKADYQRLRTRYRELMEELVLLKRRLFVAKAERVDTSQLELEFAELSKQLDALAGEVADEDGDSDSDGDIGSGSGDGDSHDDDNRKSPKGKSKGKRKRRPKGRRNLAGADNMPTIELELSDELFEQLVADGKAERIGYETAHKVAYERGGHRRLRIQRVKYRALNAQGESTIETTPRPPELLRRCMAAPSTLAHVASQKCCDGMPLYRLEDISARDGFRIDRGTMSRWLEDLGATLGATIVRAMSQDARANAFCIMTDATGFAVQPGPRDGPRRPCRKGHYFVQIADRDHILFSFHSKHTTQVVRGLFNGFEGYIQADAASVYDALFRPCGDDEGDGCKRVEVGCWSHARRKFWEAALAKEVAAREALLRMGKLFALDDKLRGKRCPPSKLAKLRNQHLRPLVEEFLTFAEREYERLKDRRGSLRSAFGYCVRQADALRAFLDDGRLRMTNNFSERELRKIVRIRDAALFAGSDLHAEAMGHILSLVASARLHNLDPERYLRDMIRVLPHWPRERFLELAPKYWQATHDNLDPDQLAAELGPLSVPDAIAIADDDTAEQPTA